MLRCTDLQFVRCSDDVNEEGCACAHARTHVHMLISSYTRSIQRWNGGIV